jgi:hypothetical protein
METSREHELMDTTHLGNGVVLFDNAINASSVEIESFIKNTELNTPNQNYKNISEDVVENDGGYRFDVLDNPSPSRFMNLIYDGMPDSDRLFIDKMNESLYLCLVEYCRLFPCVIDSVKWKTNGYLIKYEKGQNIGPHSDSAIPYDSDGNPINQFALFNTITAGLFLNDDFEGGNLRFRQWGITVRSKTLSVVMYPSSFAGCHEVEEIKSGIRYAYLQWFCQGGDNNSTGHYEKFNQLRAEVGNAQSAYVPVGKLN